MTPQEAGRHLDRRIALRVFGPQGPAAPPPYSTEDSAASRLMAELEMESLRCALSQFGGVWYCVWWRADGPAGRPERIATGSASTRPLAICRGVLNLRSELLPRRPVTRPAENRPPLFEPAPSR